VAELYAIRLEDQVTGNASRIASAYVDVSVAAQYLARSVKTADKDMEALDRHMLKLARTQLMAAKAAQTAGNAVARMGPRLPTNAVNAHTRAQKAGTAQTWKFSYALNALTNQAVSLGFAFARKLADGLVSVASGLYDVADLASRAHMSFGAFFGGQAKGDKVLRETIDIAKRYGFTIEDVAAQMNRFGAAGFTAEQSKGTLRFGADMLAAGRSVQDVKGIFLAMTQIMGKGKLQAEELTQQLAERGINAGRVWQILGKIMGKTVDEVMKLQKAGKIGAGIALNAIVQAGVEGVHGSAIGKAGERVADQTVGGLGRRMGTLWESAIFDAVDQANPALVKGMQSLFGGMNASSAGGLQDNLTKMLEGVGKFMEQVGPQIPAMVDGFTKAFGAAAGFKTQDFKSFADSLPEVARNLGLIAGSIARIAALAGTILAPDFSFEAIASAFDSAGGGKGTAKDRGLLDSEAAQMNMATDAKNRASGDSAIADSAGKSIAEGMADGILKGAPSVSKAAETLGQGAIDSSKDTLGIHSPSTKFRSQGENMAHSLAMGMDQNADFAMHSAAMLAESAMAASAGASGLDPRRGIAAGSAAGAAVSSRSSSSARVTIGDVYIGGGSGSSGGAGGAVDREYFESEFVSFLERHLEGVGA